MKLSLRRQNPHKEPKNTISCVPGFGSANLHLNFDRTQVANYAQGKSREAIEAARENLQAVEQL